jgi:flagellar hook protein FlgE
MSLYGALQIGVAGLSANSAALSVASSNIANVNTVGYKAGTSNFSTLLASSAGAGQIEDAGVVASESQNITAQGGSLAGTSQTSMSIKGNGFFVVSDQAPGAGSQDQLYTRAGNFSPDANGNLVNAAGYYLQGWKLDTSGNLPADRSNLTNVNVSNFSGSASASTEMTLQANLQATTTPDTTYAAGDMAAGTTTADFNRTINVYDSQGGSEPLNVAYKKTGANTWAYEVTYQGTQSNIGSPANGLIGSGTLTFNSDGTLANVNGASPASGSANITIPFVTANSGLAPQTIAINMGTPGSSDGITQFANPSTLVNSSVDGALFGSLTGVTVDTNGYVTANFSNGLSQKVFKIPVATFANADGLTAVSGNAYTVSNQSGTATVGEANLGGAGQIDANTLEGSTVDLATEFTNLITTQRAYSASARIVTTADQMLQTLEQIQ